MSFTFTQMRLFNCVLVVVITVVVLIVVTCYWIHFDGMDTAITDYAMPTDTQQAVHESSGPRDHFKRTVHVRISRTCPGNLYDFMLLEWLPFVSILAKHRHATEILLHGREQWNRSAVDAYFEQIANEYQMDVLLYWELTPSAKIDAYCLGDCAPTENETLVDFANDRHLKAFRETIQFVKHTVLTLEAQSDIVFQLTTELGKPNDILKEFGQRTIQEYPELKIRLDSPAHRSTSIVTQLRLYINAKAVVMTRGAGCVFALFLQTSPDRSKSALVIEVGARRSTIIGKMTKMANLRHLHVSHTRQIAKLVRNFSSLVSAR